MGHHWFCSFYADYGTAAEGICGKARVIGYTYPEPSDFQHLETLFLMVNSISFHVWLAMDFIYPCNLKIGKEMFYQKVLFINIASWYPGTIRTPNVLIDQIKRV